MAFIAAESAGLEPMSLGYPRNIAEAAALGSAADMMRFLNEGAEPVRVYPLRREVISGAVRHASGLEAAIWSGQVELVQVLDERYPIPLEERHRMICLARELGAADIESYLHGGRAVSCDGSIVDEITARPVAATP